MVGCHVGPVIYASGYNQRPLGIFYHCSRCTSTRCGSTVSLAPWKAGSLDVVRAAHAPLCLANLFR